MLVSVNNLQCEFHIPNHFPMTKQLALSRIIEIPSKLTHRSTSFRAIDLTYEHVTIGFKSNSSLIFTIKI